MISMKKQPLITARRANRELKRYIRDHGFEDNGTCYFRSGFMDIQMKTFLEQQGTIQYAGRMTDLKRKGVIVPDQFVMVDRSGMSYMHKLNDNSVVG